MRNYIEIGSCDFDTLNDKFADRDSWCGITVEAVPEYLARVEKYGKNRYINAVCGNCDEPPEIDFHYIPPENLSGLPSWAKGIGSSKMTTSLNNYGKSVKHIKAKTIDIFDVLEMVDHVDLLKIDAEGMDYDLVMATLDAGQRPTHLIFETVFMSDPQINHLCQRLVRNGYRYRGRKGDSVQFSQPSVLMICDPEWSTGSIAKDLRELSRWQVDLMDWRHKPKDFSKTLREYDAVVSFVLSTPEKWPELRNHGVICCGEVDIDAMYNSNVNNGAPLAKCVGAVCPALFSRLTKTVFEGGIFETFASATISRRFRRRRSVEQIGAVGFVGRNDGSPVKRPDMFIEICKGAGVTPVFSEREFSYHSMLQFYGSIDMLVCTSTSEGGPLPVFEAIASGIPVISTDVGLVKNMFTIPKFTSVAMATTIIEKLKTDKAYRTRTIDRQHEEFENEFTMEKFVPAWEEFFHACKHQETKFI